MPTIKVPGGLVSLSKVDFKCPHCEKNYDDTDDKYFNRCSDNKSGITKIKCECKKEFYTAYNYKGDIISFVK